MSGTKRYRKKPVVIEAMEYTGANAADLMVWSDKVSWLNTPDNPESTLVVWTLEGGMTVRPGDFLIRGIKGEFYPCKPDIFATTYEEAPDARA